MTTELKRESFGMTSKGAVVLIQMNNTGDADEHHYSYQVRHGVRTVGTYPSHAKAKAVADALMEEVPA